MELGDVQWVYSYLLVGVKYRVSVFHRAFEFAREGVVRTGD